MKFFFTKDYKKRYRFFSSEPPLHTEEQLSRWKKLWETAKQKLMRLPQRTLAQELAFQRGLKIKETKVEVLYAGTTEKQKIKDKFLNFLHKQKTKHIFLLVGEIILLPLSGLAAFLPGPNVFFYFLALLIITNWLALRGISKLLYKNLQFIPSSTLQEWEHNLEEKKEENYLTILKKIEQIHNLPHIKKVLWK